MKGERAKNDIFFFKKSIVMLGAYVILNANPYRVWQRFWFIIVPSIRQVIFVNLVINISGALSIYEMPYIMTGGANGTKTFLMNILDTAFKYNKYGVASSMSLVLLAVVLLVAVLQKLVIGKEEAE